MAFVAWHIFPPHIIIMLGFTITKVNYRKRKDLVDVNKLIFTFVLIVKGD